MDDAELSRASLAPLRRRGFARVARALRELAADPLFSPAHIERLYRVYRIAIPLYAVLTFATAANRLRDDRVMAVLWALQGVVASLTYAALLLGRKRAHRVMQAGFAVLMVGMLARIPRAVSVSALQDVDLHALTVGIILALLVGQTLFAPRVARRVNLTCAALTGLTAVVSLLWVEHLTVAHVFPVVRLIAASATLVALVGFVSNSVYEYGRLWEEHRLMQTLAMCDPLTDLPNRRACEASLLREIARATREGGVFSVVMLDVDHFKSINDQFGHEAGDQALVAVADILRRSLRASDEAARWAGDEFVLVLPATSIENAHFVAERIRRAVGAAQLRPAEATVTLGVAEFIAGQDDPQTLLARADANLYEAKRKGRNCTVAA